MQRSYNRLRRFGWIYGVLLALVVWPLFLLRLNRYPPVNMEAIREASAFQQERRDKTLGPSIYREFEALWTTDNLVEAFSEDPRARRLHDVLWPAADQPWVIEDEVVRLIYGDPMTEWSNLDGEGLYAMRAQDLIAIYEAGDLGRYNLIVRNTSGTGHRPNFFRYRSRAHLAFAVQAMGDNDWDEALSQIDQALALWRPLFGGETYWPHWQFLSTASDAYAETIRRRPPPQIEARIVRRLNELLTEARRWPQYPMRAVAEKLPFDHTQFDDWADSGYMTLRPAQVLSATRAGITIDDPLLSFWTRGMPFVWRYRYLADERIRRYVRNDIGMWSAVPAEIAFLKRISRRHPGILDSHGLPDETIERLDRWTLASTLSYEHRSDQYGMKARLAEEMTRLQLLEIQIAAENFFVARRHWPDEIEQLVPQFLDELPTGIEIKEFHTWNLGAVADVILPIQMRQIGLGDANESELWSWLISDRIRGLSRQLDWIARFRDAQGVVEVAEPHNVQGWLMVAYGLAAELEAHEPFVSDVSVDVLGEAHPDFTLSRTTAMALTAFDDRTFQEHRKGPNLELDAESELLRERGAEPDRYHEGRSQGYHWQAVLRAQLRTSGKVFAIWSPGPDGVNQRAFPPYGLITLQGHHGHQTFAGDIAVFPKGP